MSKVMLVANKLTTIERNDDFHYIGVDRGAFLLMEKNIPMDYAIGDFDSITKDEYNQLQIYTKIKKLPTRKNDSDSEYAIKFACEHYDEVWITGVSGGRLDHFISLYHLLAFTSTPFTLVDDQNKMYKLGVGEHKIKKGNYPYLSLFACEASKITLKDVEYPLTNQPLNVNDVYTLSNEIVGEEATIIIEEGSFVIIQSSDNSTQ